MRASPLDVLVIAVYLVGITLFGIRVGYRREASTDQYFLAGKSLGWFTVGAAVFTSNAERPRDALHGVQFQPLGSQPATRVRQSLRLSAPIGRRPTIAST